MKAKALLLSLALGISILCVGCEDDQINYFFSSDAGLFFFSFGNTVTTKPLEQGGATSQASGQSQSTSTQITTPPNPQSDTNSYQNLPHTFDLSTLTTTFDKTTEVATPSGTSATGGTSQE